VRQGERRDEGRARLSLLFAFPERFQPHHDRADAAPVAASQRRVCLSPDALLIDGYWDGMGYVLGWCISGDNGQ